MKRPIYRILSGKFGERLELRILTRRTAKVFGADAPKTRGHSAPERLNGYAQMTSEEAERALQSGRDLVPLHRELFSMAERLGNRVCRWLKPKDEQDCLAILVMLYRHLGITIREEGNREFIVSECFFSAFYTPEVCAVISAIDQGIFFGVYGGGTLTFCARITEGQEACRAEFTIKASSIDD